MKATIKVESTPSKNFQKHSCGIEIEVEYETQEELLEKISYHQAICRKQAKEQIKLDG